MLKAIALTAILSASILPVFAQISPQANLVYAKLGTHGCGADLVMKTKKIKIENQRGIFDATLFGCFDNSKERLDFSNGQICDLVFYKKNNAQAECLKF
jgi:hypothetical protein